MSDYQMIIHTREDAIGHFVIEITGPGGQRVVGGFEPKGKMDRLYSTTLFPVDGKVDNDKTKFDRQRGDFKSSKSIPQTKEAFGRVAKVSDPDKLTQTFGGYLGFL